MLDQVPFLIGQVGRICLSGRHAPQDNRSRPAQTSFLDTLLGGKTIGMLRNTREYSGLVDVAVHWGVNNLP
jgi:hypothetical protein